jgi:hypothetical protein
VDHRLAEQDTPQRHQPGGQGQRRPANLGGQQSRGHRGAQRCEQLGAAGHRGVLAHQQVQRQRSQARSPTGRGPGLGREDGVGLAPAYPVLLTRTVVGRAFRNTGVVGKVHPEPGSSALPVLRPGRVSPDRDVAGGSQARTPASDRMASVGSGSLRVHPTSASCAAPLSPACQAPSVASHSRSPVHSWLRSARQPPRTAAVTASSWVPERRAAGQ